MSTQTFKVSRTYPTHQFQNWISQTEDLIGTIPTPDNVLFWGAKGNDINDDSAAIQRAIDGAGTASGLFLYFPPGIYKIDSSINIADKTNVYLQGESAIIDGSGIPLTGVNETAPGMFSFTGTQILATTVTVNMTEGDITVTLASVAGAAVGDILYFYSGTSESNIDGQLFYKDENRINRINHGEIVRITGNVVTLANAVEFSMSTGGFVVNCLVHRPSKNISIDGFQFYGGNTVNALLQNGQGIQGIKANRCYNLNITNCTFKWCQGFALLISRSHFVRISNCLSYGYPDGYIYSDFVEPFGTGYYNFFMQYCYQVQVLNCQSFKTRHFTDSSLTGHYIVVGNTSSDSHRAPYRAHGGTYYSIINDNIALGGNGAVANSGWIISECCNNHFETLTAGGNPCILDGAASSSSFDSVSQGSLSGESIFRDNVIKTQFDLSPSVRLNNFYSKLICDGNTMIGQSGITVDAITANNVSISGNSIECNPAVLADGIRIGSKVLDVSKNNYVISNNNISGFGRGGIRVEGCGTRAARMNNVTVSNNAINASAGGTGGVGFSTGYFGRGIYAADNTIIGTSNVIYTATPGYNFERFPTLVYGGPRDVSTTANGPNEVGRNTTPTLTLGATVQLGAIMYNSAPAAGESIGWQAMTNGTAGTLVGVTATTNGTTTIVLVGNDDTKVYVGSWITVNAVSRQVLTVSADFATITVSATVAAGGPGLPVIYTDPTFVEFGRIANTITGWTTTTGASVPVRSLATGDNTAAQLTNAFKQLLADLNTNGLLGVTITP